MKDLLRHHVDLSKESKTVSKLEAPNSLPLASQTDNDSFISLYTLKYTSLMSILIEFSTYLHDTLSTFVLKISTLDENDSLSINPATTLDTAKVKYKTPYKNTSLKLSEGVLSNSNIIDDFHFKYISQISQIDHSIGTICATLQTIREKHEVFEYLFFFNIFQVISF